MESDSIKKILPMNCRVLVVDDEPFNVMAVKLVFRHFPWVKLDEAYCGIDAIRIIVFLLCLLKFLE